jgi:hypothetical protein
MGYFSNGSQAADYQAQFCDRCFHDRDNNCPILLLHLLWNYDAVGRNADETKKIALNTFIPCEGIQNKQCLMFVPCALISDEIRQSENSRRAERAALERWNEGKPIKATP